MNPRVSFVATSRNDDHGGDLLSRMQTFLDGLAEQCDRHELDAELVLVEWNPPADRPRLIEALNWPGESRCHVRIIEVPPHVHSRFRHADALPLFQMIAKNVGIRRARSPFILATNVDVLFSDELMEFLASGKLQTDRMYRVDRLDVQGVPIEQAIGERLAWCRSNVVRICAREGTYRSWLRRRFAVLRRRATQRGRKESPPALHINASGDFTLLAREKWFELRGYPELEVFSMNIDALLCFMAHYAGAVECVLPSRACIYHLEHRAGWTPESDQTLRSNVARRRIPWIEWEQVKSWAREMDRLGGPLTFNSDAWGLAAETLHEFTPSTRASAIAEAPASVPNSPRATALTTSV